MKQMKCGLCGNKTHNVFRNGNTDIYLQCTKCENMSILRVSKPKIEIDNCSGDGCITVF